MNDGIHQITRELYDARSGWVNWSTLKHMKKSPAHYRHALISERNDTASLKRGRVAHIATFEPDQVGERCAVWRGGDRRGKEWKQFQRENATRDIVTETEWSSAEQIQRAVHGHQLASKYVQGGIPEASMFWTLKAPELGGVPGWEIKCRGRVDFIAKVGAIVDLKTSRDASVDGFAKLSAQYGYHSQAAFYVDGYEAITGTRLPYVIVAVEPSAPFAVTVFELDEQALAVGRQSYRELLDRLALCRAEARYPAYSDQLVPLSLPRWALPFDEEDADGMGLVFKESTEEAAQGE